MKAYLRSSQELILAVGNDNNHSLAFPLSENGNNLSLRIFFSTFLNFFISQISQKSCKCIEASSLELPQNCSLVIRFNSPGLTLKVSTAVISGVVIGLAIK
jgi:hypothetical protein